MAIPGGRLDHLHPRPRGQLRNHLSVADRFNLQALSSASRFRKRRNDVDRAAGIDDRDMQKPKGAPGANAEGKIKRWRLVGGRSRKSSPFSTSPRMGEDPRRR
jgi:hypothetical protein